MMERFPPTTIKRGSVNQEWWSGFPDEAVCNVEADQRDEGRRSSLHCANRVPSTSRDGTTEGTNQ
jgi:hypothetical protein